MKKLIVIIILALALILGVQAVTATGTTLYVDGTNNCNGNSPCYLHPQDAVNAANPGDTILVYPGTYDSRYFVCDPVHPTWCSPNDNWAPALIVYKDGLTIKSVDGPANTIIQSTHNLWSNAIAVQNSTAGAIVGVTGWSPNAITIVANKVTIDGFALHRHYEGTWATYNTAGVFIGSKGAGYADFLGQANGATIQNNIFSDVWHAVYIWHSSGNIIENNTVAALGSTGHWAAISTYDGDSDAKIGLGFLSENNLIANNTLADKGISLGAWAPKIWTSNAASQVCFNTTTQVGVAYAHGPVIIGCNSGGFWQSNTDNVIRITGITYNGDTGAFPVGTAINLNAQLTYDGSSDGSGVAVVFPIDGTDYTATTVAGGGASTTANLPVGVYEIQAKVTICGDCVFTSDTQFVVVYDPSAGFVTGGGSIMSPAGAYASDPLLEGKATFGFVSKYKKGASVPDGNTEFQFKAGDLNFHSTFYKWLIVNQNYTNAQFMGYGTINGVGDYGFMIWAGDGSPDTFRIMILDATTRDPIYDNGVQQPIEGGSIVIHK